MVPKLMKTLRSFRSSYAYITAQPAGRAAIFFTMEGILFTLVNNMINNNNNLFAMRLGASDMEISLLDHICTDNRPDFSDPRSHTDRQVAG